MKLFYVVYRANREYIVTGIRGYTFPHIKRILKKENKNIHIIRMEILE